MEKFLRIDFFTLKLIPIQRQKQDSLFIVGQ